MAESLGSNHLQSLFLPRLALTCTLIPEDESECPNKITGAQDPAHAGGFGCKE